jgi:hypothetical protein
MVWLTCVKDSVIGRVATTHVVAQVRIAVASRHHAVRRRTLDLSSGAASRVLAAGGRRVAAGGARQRA